MVVGTAARYMQKMGCLRAERVIWCLILPFEAEALTGHGPALGIQDTWSHVLHSNCHAELSSSWGQLLM